MQKETNSAHKTEQMLICVCETTIILQDTTQVFYVYSPFCHTEYGGKVITRVEV